MDQLLTLPGVARKTANVVLGTWFKKNEGVVVDTHVHRISRRLELTRNDDPKKIEQDLMQILPREKWTLFSHQIIWHGRKLCIARRPKCVRLPAGKYLPRRRQNLEHSRNPQKRRYRICHPERSEMFRSRNISRSRRTPIASTKPNLIGFLNFGTTRPRLS